MVPSVQGRSLQSAPQKAAQVVRVAVPKARAGDGDREEKETYISLTLCAI